MTMRAKPGAPGPVSAARRWWRRRRRRATWPKRNEFTWLAYTVYGNPFARAVQCWRLLGSGPLPHPAPGPDAPVFQTTLANAVRICGARFGHLLLNDGKEFRAAARDPHTRPRASQDTHFPSGPRYPGPPLSPQVASAKEVADTRATRAIKIRSRLLIGVPQTDIRYTTHVMVSRYMAEG